MSDIVQRLTDPHGEPSGRCTWCRGPLPPYGAALEVVRPSDGLVMETCSAACLGEFSALRLVSWPTADGRRRVGGRPSVRRPGAEDV
jgi:hypothetical protein